MSQKRNIVRRGFDFVRERFPAEKLTFRSMVEKKDVPVHKMSWAYFLGGLALFFFLIQLVTGVMLLFYYEPSVSDAHESVEFITHHVTGGALVRNLHAWSSSAMIFFVVMHLLTTFAMKAFKKPRELTWLSGVALLMLVFAFGFTGYLLPWNQIAVNATKVGLQSIEGIGAYMPGALADLPRIIRETIQGEASVGQATLSRFYAIHVVVLPLISLALIGAHLFFIQVQGMSKGVDDVTRTRSERFFPFFVLKDLKIWGIVFFIIAVIALCLPFEAFFDYPLFAAYDPLGSTPDGIKPEWYFYFLYYPLEMLPYWVILVAQAVLIGVLLATPRIFQGTSRKVLRGLALVALAYLIIITLFGEAIYLAVSGH